MSRRQKIVNKETQIHAEANDPSVSKKIEVDDKKVSVNTTSQTISFGLITNNGRAKGRPDTSVCKIISLDENDKLTKDSVASIYRGRARVQKVEFCEFGEVLSGLKSIQTITLGVPHNHEEDGGGVIDDSVLLLTKDKVAKSSEKAISRTKEYFKMLERQPGLALIDMDGLPDNITTLDDARDLLTSICPELKGCAAWAVASSSSFIKKGEKYYSHLKGVHIYFVLKYGKYLKDFVCWVHDKSLLKGVDKSVFDKLVGSPERLIFEVKPELRDGLEKDDIPPKYYEGGRVDFESFPKLTVEEEQKCRELTGKKQSSKILRDNTDDLEIPVIFSTIGASNPNDVLNTVFRPALVRSAMEFIEPDEDYNTWVTTGMALYNITEGAEYGLRMFDEWSRNDGHSKKYEKGVCKTKWDSFCGNHEDGVGIDTLFFMAKVNGWEGEYSRSSNAAKYVNDERFAVLKVFSEFYTFVMIGGKPVIVYKVKDRLNSTGSVSDFYRTEFSAKNSVQDWENQVWIPKVVYGTGKNSLEIIKIEKQSAFFTWFNSKWRQQVVGVQMAPFKTTDKQSLIPLVDEGFYNFFNGLAITPKKGGWDLIRQHIFDIICDGREEVFEYFMNLLAFMFQKPSERSGIIVVMVSDSGTGKNVIMQPIVDALRPHSYMADSPDRICGQFNDHLAQLICVVANEAVFGARYVDTLKTLATEPTLQAERKGMPSVEVNNCIHLFILTNNKKAVPLDFFDRRMFFLDVSSA